VALTLGRLQAREAVPEMVSIIHEGYTFSDSVALASGKHGGKSQKVRWRGFFCIALGRMGGAPALQALETLAVDAGQPRDIRYSAVIGLGLAGQPRSLPALEQVAHEDIIWMVRDEARQATQRIQLAVRATRQ